MDRVSSVVMVMGVSELFALLSGEIAETGRVMNNKIFTVIML